MLITMIESDILWGQSESNMRRLDAILERYFAAASAIPDLVMLPECFSTGFAMTPEMTEDESVSLSVSWLKCTARKYSVAIYSSVAVKVRENYYNRGYFILPSGEIAATYDKRHLFMGDEADFYTAGDRPVTVDYRGWRFALNICYDLRFPVWSRNVPDTHGKYYDIMLNVSNWPTSRLDVVQVMTRSRALENQAYMLFCNRIGEDSITTYSGGSVAVDPKGRPFGNQSHIDGIRIIEAEPDRLWMDSFRDYFPVLKSADGFKLV